MNPIMRITYRQLWKMKASTLFTFLGIFFSTLLLSTILIGGSSLRESIVLTENSFYGPIISIASWIFSAVIIIISAVLIHNSIFLSLTQKIKLLSQLSGLGCSKKHLKQNVYYELIMISTVAIPTAIILSILSMKIVFVYLNTFVSFKNRIGAIKIYADIITILILCICLILTLILSARKSIRMVLQTSPLEGMKLISVLPITKSKAGWKKDKSIPFQLAQKNIRRNPFRYRVISNGIICCIVLLCVSNTFTSGIKVLYKNREAPFAYRVALWGEQGNYPEEPIHMCENMLPQYAIRTEELQFSMQNENNSYINCKVIVFEDELFEKICGNVIKKSNNDVECILVKSVSNIEMSSIYYLGTEFKVVDNIDSLPMGIGRNDGINSDIVYATSRTAFDAGYTPIGDRSFYVYFDIDDGRNLNTSIEPILISSGIRYMIQDYTITSQWAMQGEALTLLLSVISICFPVLILIVFIVEMITTICSNVLLRRKEIAVFKCNGLKKGEIELMLLYESIDYIKNGIIFGIPIGVILSEFIINKLNISLMDVFPLKLMLLTITLVIGGALLSLKICNNFISRLSIVEEIRNIE